ncbi:hypothetical protein ONZ45_g15454 [Pleurotus djamor]|nr:hypothetical protein ONZ45_g15454 [Pleurotus djamor]
MSRRDARVSLGARQNDALVEFESFKKKFLLANKHITKLNSTLSVRIEELNAQISTLYVENLRLRASEIALTAQLKREKAKSSKVIAEAEAATQSLTKHLNYLRHTLNIPQLSPPSSKEVSPANTPPQIRNTNSEPRDEALRVARPPNVPEINEEEEPPTDDNDPLPEATRSRNTARSRGASSHAAAPSLVPSGSRRKSSSSVRRRESGLLMEMTVRPGSPTVGSPVPRQLEVEEDVEEDAAGEEDIKPMRSASRRTQKVEEPDEDHEDDDYRPTRRKQREDNADKKERRRRPKDIASEMPQEVEAEVDVVAEMDQVKEKKVKSKTKPRLMDVTNSPRGSVGLTLRPEDIIYSTANNPDVLNSASSSKSRSFLAPRPGSTTSSSSSSQATSSSSSSKLPPPHQYHREPPEASSSKTYAPPLSTPRPSTSPPPDDDMDADNAEEVLKDDLGFEALGGRERRSRKSVNYAEPKLNTKMRKPDPPPGTLPGAKASKKRSSTASTSVQPPPEVDGTVKGKRKRGSDGSELALPEEQPPDNLGTPWVQASFVVRTRKPKANDADVIDHEDEDEQDNQEESDGDQADGEFTTHRYKTKSGAGVLDSAPDGWANVDQSRRRSHSSAAGKIPTGSRTKRKTAGGEAGGGFLTDWEERRHSLAV